MDVEQLHECAQTLLIESGALDELSLTAYLKDKGEEAPAELISTVIVSFQQRLQQMFRQQHAIEQLPNGFADSLNQWFVQLNRSVDARVERLSLQREQSLEQERRAFQQQHQQQLNELQSHSQCLEKDVSQRQSQLDVLEQKNTDLQQQLHLASQEQHARLSELNQQKTEYDHQQSRLAQLQSENEQAMTEQQKKYHQLHELHQGLQLQLDSVLNKLDQYQEDGEAKQSQREQDQREKLEQTQQALHLKEAEFTQQVDASRLELEQLQQRYARLDLEHQRAQSELDLQLKSAKQHADDAALRASSSNDQLIKEKQQQASEIHSLEQRLQQSSSQQTTLQQRIEDLESKYLDSAEDVNQVKMKLAAANSQLQLNQLRNTEDQEAELQLQDIRQRLKAIDLKYKTEQDGHHVTKQAVIKLEEELMDSQIESRSVQKELEAIQERLAERDLYTHQLQRQIEDANQDMLSLTEANSRLSAQLS